MKNTIALIYILFSIFNEAFAANTIDSTLFKNQNDSSDTKIIVPPSFSRNIFNINLQGSNLILNGDFEQGKKYFSSNLEYSSQEVLPGNYSITKNAFKHNTNFASVNDHTTGSGHYMLVDASSEENSKNWCSKVKIDKQAQYEFSAFLSNINLKFRYPAQIRLTVNGVPVGEARGLSDNNNEWIEYKWQWFSGDNNDSIDFCLEDMESISDGNDYGIDDIVLYKISQKVEIPKEVCPNAGDTLFPVVHFPFNESTITEYSKEKLQQLLVILQKCPKMKILITGHTDMFGSNAFNNKLSENRAKAIFNYLQNNGIVPERMQQKSFGESQIIYDGNSIKENVKNRRVQFVVTGFIE